VLRLDAQERPPTKQKAAGVAQPAGASVDPAQAAQATENPQLLRCLSIHPLNPLQTTTLRLGWRMTNDGSKDEVDALRLRGCKPSVSGTALGSGQAVVGPWRCGWPLNCSAAEPPLRRHETGSKTSILCQLSFAVQRHRVSQRFVGFRYAMERMGCD
jgi:hypothetical protein